MNVICAGCYGKELNEMLSKNKSQDGHQQQQTKLFKQVICTEQTGRPSIVGWRIRWKKTHNV